MSKRFSYDARAVVLSSNQYKSAVESASENWGKNEQQKHNALFEKLLGDLSGAYSRRINIQHRLVYQVFAEEKVVKIIRMWTHYE